MKIRFPARMSLAGTSFSGTAWSTKALLSGAGLSWTGLALLGLFFSAAILSNPGFLSAVELNKPAPEFSLQSYSGETVSLADFKGKTVILEWINPECPFVMKHYKSGHMQKLQADAKKDGLVWLSINSTAQGHKNFKSPEEMLEFMKEHKIEDVQMLIDADGKVGHLYQAKTTPHMFIVNQEGVLVYDGAIDDQADSDGDPKTARNFVTLAVEELKAGKKVSTAATSPYGCSVKYAS